MTSLPPSRTPTQRLQDAVNVHDLSLQQLAILFRDVAHEINIRIDGLTPGGDDLAHSAYHRRKQDQEIMEQQNKALRSAQYWAGVRIGATALAVFLGAVFIYAIYKQAAQ